MRSHLCGSPIAEAAVVHGKPVVMFGNRNNVLCARFFEQFSPSGWIEAFGFEYGNEILVAEFVLRAICLDMVLVFFRAGLIHAARVPLVAKGGDRIDSPMNENAKLCIFVPIGRFVFA